MPSIKDVAELAGLFVDRIFAEAVAQELHGDFRLRSEYLV